MKLTKTIKVEGIEDKGFKLVLKAGKEKYDIWKKEFDKTLGRSGDQDSEPYLQYLEAKIGYGAEVTIEYSEKQKEYEGKPYTARSIWRFIQHTPTPVTPVTPYEEDEEAPF